MRGKVLKADHSQAVHRITPAHAGKRLYISNFSGVVQDHPRACGEKTTCAATTWRGRGSPPRMRGKELHLCPCPRDDGITPAHAGKSPKSIDI